MAVKAVIDTNIWISALINPFGFPARIREQFEKGTFTAVISMPIIEEIADVLSRPRIRNKYGITDNDIEELLILIDERAENVKVSADIDICLDKDDNLVIESAIKGKAQYLIARDDDMKFDIKVLSFLKQHDVSVVSIDKFLRVISKT